MHMKKTFLLLLLVSTLLFSCSKSDFAYDDWNKIEISGCGSIEIPDKWSHFYEDGMLYIIDENAEPVIIQCDNYKIYEGDSNKFYSNYRKIECVYSESFSNSSSYEISKFLFDNKEVELPIIGLYVESDETLDEDVALDKSVNLIVWKTDIGEKMIKKIAKSYISIVSE